MASSSAAIRKTDCGLEPPHTCRARRCGFFRNVGRCQGNSPGRPLDTGYSGKTVLLSLAEDLTRVPRNRSHPTLRSPRPSPDRALFGAKYGLILVQTPAARAA